MGAYYHEMQVFSIDGSRWETVEALVDTGASHTVLPSGMLRRLGAVPYRTVLRRIADGGRIPREIGETKLRVNGLEATRIVAFGDDDPPPLLGADTSRASCWRWIQSRICWSPPMRCCFVIGEYLC